MKHLFILLTTFNILVGCVDQSNKNNYTTTTTITITSNTTLDKHYTDTTFIVQNGAVLDMNGFSNVSTNTHSGVILMGQGSTIQNGVIDGFYNGIETRANDLSEFNSKIRQTNIITGTALEQNEQLKHIMNQQIKNMKVLNSSHVGIYITAFTGNTRIVDNSILNTGHVGIYLGRDSHHSNIRRNVIDGCGYGAGDFSQGRECIAVDTSQYNTIRNNTIRSAKLAGITSYRNCGENGVPRWLGSNYNSISINRFEDLNIGIWISSRKNDRVSSTCRPDDPGDESNFNKVFDNQFKNVNYNIINEGKNNEIK